MACTTSVFVELVVMEAYHFEGWMCESGRRGKFQETMGNLEYGYYVSTDFIIQISLAFWEHPLRNFCANDERLVRQMKNRHNAILIHCAIEKSYQTNCTTLPLPPKNPFQSEMNEVFSSQTCLKISVFSAFT